MKQIHWLMAFVTLLAFVLRVWRLDQSPPGFRDDELINVLVISQKALDGDLTPFYPDASGHESLYHILNAGIFALFGRNLFGIRGLSLYFGVLSIPLLFQLGRRLFNDAVGVTAAAALAVSFWGLMYSRFALRHIGLIVTITPAFIAFWRMLQIRQTERLDSRPLPSTIWCGVWLGASFYIYFAARGAPLILIAFAVYLWAADRPLFRKLWRDILQALGIAGILAIPLIRTLAQLPADEGRIAELALPIVAAREGNFRPLLTHIQETLSMFHATGDSEWLYNIPQRPIFGVIGALFFWIAILWGSIQIIKAAAAKHPQQHVHAAAFVLLWWLAGISPAFISVPPASLSHTILAQPAVFLLAALPVAALPQTAKSWQRYMPTALGLLLNAGIAARDLPAYFQEWSTRGNVRFLYHADLQNIGAATAKDDTLTDFGVTGLLDGPWGKLALDIALQTSGDDIRPRWFYPERALMIELAGKPAQNFNGYPLIPDPYQNAYAQPPLQNAGGYRLNQVDFELTDPFPTPICFENGLCAVAAQYDAAAQQLSLAFRAERQLSLPPFQLISNPPPPDVYSGARLAVFGQLISDLGEFLVGDDGLGVDPYGLQAGDLFQQRHNLALPPGSVPAQALFGLYDPKTGIRIGTEDGADHIALPLEQ